MVKLARIWWVLKNLNKPHTRHWSEETLKWECQLQREWHQHLNLPNSNSSPPITEDTTTPIMFLLLFCSFFLSFLLACLLTFHSLGHEILMILLVSVLGCNILLSSSLIPTYFQWHPITPSPLITSISNGTSPPPWALIPTTFNYSGKISPPHRSSKEHERINTWISPKFQCRPVHYYLWATTD